MNAEWIVLRILFCNITLKFKFYYFNCMWSAWLIRCNIASKHCWYWHPFTQPKCKYIHAQNTTQNGQKKFMRIKSSTIKLIININTLNTLASNNIILRSGVTRILTKRLLLLEYQRNGVGHLKCGELLTTILLSCITSPFIFRCFSQYSFHVSSVNP